MITLASLIKYRPEICVLLYIVVDYVFLELTLIYITAPLIKFETLARQNASFSRSSIRLLISYLPPMRPRTILNVINRNRGVRNELTPN
jgi:hypothetical protein